MNYKNSFKRVLDIFLSTIGLILLSPVIVLVSVLVYINLGKPIIFKQVRPGKNCNPFFLYKFRSMTNAQDTDGNLLPNAKRHTKFGKQLRSTSLDELLSLLNVLKGEMSIVGPRPLKMEYIPFYVKNQKRRHEVRPGITGWAQVNGRNSISFTERFKLDVWYVDNLSFILDLKIIFFTIIKVFKRENINPQTELKPFDGTN